ncbi:MAG: hypothetical protein LAQ30_17370 [Acidobacteriia bacterium]|nr:hypothetical protein [Terriglobia bacterium]
MPRWIAIRTSAVLAVAGSSLALLFSVGMGLFLVLAPMRDASPLPPALLKTAGVLIALLFAGISAWGVATGTGILRRRPWARVSILIFAFLLLFFGGTGVLVMAFVPLPEGSGADPRAAAAVRHLLLGLYALMTAAGAWWLCLFGRREAKPYFAADAAPVGLERPLSISIIGWYLLLCAAFTALGAALRTPAMLFGWHSTGWTAAALYTVYTAVQIYLGSGLLQLDERARVWSIAYFCFAALNGVVILALPGYPERMLALQDELQELFGMVTVPEFPQPWVLAAACAVAAGFPIWFLARGRRAFSAGGA